MATGQGYTWQLGWPVLVSELGLSLTDSVTKGVKLVRRACDRVTYRTAQWTSNMFVIRVNNVHLIP